MSIMRKTITLFSEWIELGNYLNSIWPENLGIFIYGSLLFKPIELVDDIDVVILMPYQIRKRVIKIYNEREMHINLLSKDIFLNDLNDGIYGEYYVNKIMNPYYALRETTELKEIFEKAREVKTIQALKFASSLITRPIIFCVIDLIKLITLIRIFQFPHYLYSAITIFSHSSSEPFMRLLDEYSTSLKLLVSKGMIKQVTTDQYLLLPSQNNSSFADFLKKSLKIIPLYWKTFAEVHGRGYDEIYSYLEEKVMKLNIAIKDHPNVIMEILSNSFADAIPLPWRLLL